MVSIFSSMRMRRSRMGSDCGGVSQVTILGEIGIIHLFGVSPLIRCPQKEFQILLDIGHNLFLKVATWAWSSAGRVTINSQLIHHRVEHIRQCDITGPFGREEAGLALASRAPARPAPQP